MTPGDGPRLDDPMTHTRIELRRRLEAIGCSDVRDEVKTVRNDTLKLTLTYAGRDDMGHHAQCKIQFEARPGELAEVVEQRIAKQMRAQEKRFAIAGGIAPVVPGPNMPLSHLEVTMPYARRLRLDHGEGAQDALREAIVARLSELRKARATAPKSGVPNQPSFSGHRINHREQLGEGVWLKNDNLVVANTTLPASMAIALIGRPVTAVCRHPILSDLETIREIEMANADSPHGRKTATLRLDIPWIRASEI